MKSNQVERDLRKCYRRNKKILEHREGVMIRGPEDMNREELREYNEDQEAVKPAHVDNKGAL